MIVYDRTEYKALSARQYEKEKKRLQIELLKLEEWVIKHGKKVAIVMEGRDAAGKGSTIKRFIENMMPKAVEVVALGIPSEEQEQHWFETWRDKMPAQGKITFFDRSWYSRAVIQPSMNYCTEAQYRHFMENVNAWEQSLIDDGHILIKLYLSISKESQELRFHMRESSKLKYWKLSSNDWKAHEKWKIQTKFKDQMFAKTSTNLSPWVVINANNKMICRLNAMRYVLSVIDYEGKEILEPKVWSKDLSKYEIILNGVPFDNLNKEQYELLFQLKANE